MKISNGNIAVEVNEHGAELYSIIKNGHEYIWKGDPAFWNRHAPVLFPIVGKVWDSQYRVGDKSYSLGQHGFARDMDFDLVSLKEDSVELVLKSSEKTYDRYPYSFELTIEYRIEGDKVIKKDTVRNTGDAKMFFQIGEHPAFMYMDFDERAEIHGFMEAYKSGKKVEKTQITELSKTGYAKPGKVELIHPAGELSLTAGRFDNDALVYEDSQIDRVLLLDASGKPYLEIEFPQAQVLGVWSPVGKNAPFVCIEPWNGRADSEGFSGDFSEKAWIQSLEPGREFSCEMIMKPLA